MVLKILALIALSALTASAQDGAPDRRVRNWNISVAFFAGAQAMDALSSRGAMETNPLLGRGQFGARQTAIKAAIASSVILTEWKILRRHPETRRMWTWTNYAAGTALSAVAVRNWNHSSQ